MTRTAHRMTIADLVEEMEGLRLENKALREKMGEWKTRIGRGVELRRVSTELSVNAAQIAEGFATRELLARLVAGGASEDCVISDGTATIGLIRRVYELERRWVSIESKLHMPA